MPKKRNANRKKPASIVQEPEIHDASGSPKVALASTCAIVNNDACSSNARTNDEFNATSSNSASESMKNRRSLRKKAKMFLFTKKKRAASIPSDLVSADVDASSLKKAKVKTLASSESELHPSQKLGLCMQKSKQLSLSLSRFDTSSMLSSPQMDEWRMVGLLDAVQKSNSVYSLHKLSTSHHTLHEVIETDSLEQVAVRCTVAELLTDTQSPPEFSGPSLSLFESSVFSPSVPDGCFEVCNYADTSSTSVLYDDQQDRRFHSHVEGPSNDGDSLGDNNQGLLKEVFHETVVCKNVSPDYSQDGCPEVVDQAVANLQHTLHVTEENIGFFPHELALELSFESTEMPSEVPLSEEFQSAKPVHTDEDVCDVVLVQELADLVEEMHLDLPKEVTPSDWLVLDFAKID